MSGILENTGALVGIITGAITILDRVAKEKQKRIEATEPAGGVAARRSLALWELWSINRVRVTAMMVGVATYVIANGAAHHDGYKFHGPITLTSLGLVTALVAGAWYGPWVGLVTGAVGYPLTALYASGSSGPMSFPFPPAYSIGDGLVGFAGGLVCLYVRSFPGQEKPDRQTLIVSDIIAAVAVVIGDLLSNATAVHERLDVTGSSFMSGLRSDLLCALVIPPIALLNRPTNAAPPVVEEPS